MTYSVDRAYVDYFKCAAEGQYDAGFSWDRLTVACFAAGTACVGIFRTAGRIINLVNEVAKVLFYALASLITSLEYGNRERLRDHCKLFVLNAGALVAQPFQVAVHLCAIAFGIFIPKTANRMMQRGSLPLAWITSQENKIWQQYKTPKVYTFLSNYLQHELVNIIQNKCSSAARVALITIVTEFSSSLDAGLVAPLGYRDRFPLFEANPIELTKDQRKLSPILLLNGNYSHQATFLPLLHSLKCSGNQRPVYTINLPSNCTDTALITTKVALIQMQYLKTADSSFEIDMIGHSMGSDLIQDLCLIKGRHKRSHDWNPNFQIGRVITIGTPISIIKTQNVAKQTFDIVGKRDLLEGCKSDLKEENKRVIDTGHLGLLDHPESLQAIQVFLNT